MIPTPFADEWPLQRLGLARVLTGAMVAVSLFGWALPDRDLRESRDAVHRYAALHPLETLPDGCESWLESDHWVALRSRSSSSHFERSCIAARDEATRAGVRRFGIGRPATPGQWLLAPATFSDPLALLAGGWLLAAVCGGLLERRRGRAVTGAVWLAGAILPALTWSALAGEAATPWLGAAALVSFVVAATVTANPDEQVRFWIPGDRDDQELPMWTLLGWWLALRLLGVAFFGIERSALAAEVLALPLGAAVGRLARLGLAEALQRAVEQGKTQLRAAAEPVPVGPAVVDNHARAAPPPSQPSRHIPDPEKTVHEVEETMDSVEDEALAALFAEDPVPVPVRIATHRASATPLQGAGLGADSPGPEAGPSVATKIAAAAGSVDRPIDTALELDDLLGSLASAGSSKPAGPSAPLWAAAPDARALPQPLQVPEKRKLEPAPEQTAVVPTEPTSLWVPPRPVEATRAYAGSTGEAIRATIEAVAEAARPAPLVRLTQLLRRADSGTLECLIEGSWESLSADLVRAVAVGLVEHRNWAGAQPEIWIDVILERGARQRRAEAVRVHLSREALGELAPSLSSAQAFSALAEELAAAGALRLPQQQVWPGPPWPRYSTAADFIHMWQREIG